MAYSTLIAKPTKFCNATCAYCCAPTEVNGAPKWSIDEFKAYFDKLHPYLMPRALILWHGGEPMLMGPDFYWKAWDYVQEVKPGIRFSMQSNILGYDSRRWKDLLKGPFEGSVSTSFDPDEQHREFRGSTSLYTKIFNARLDAMLNDGFHPKVIGTYTEETIHLAHTMYDRAMALGEDAFDVRVNYRYPAGRDDGNGAMITPESYGKVLLELYERWIKDVPSFLVTPLDDMFNKTIGIDGSRCPWTRSCGGHFLGLEPNGDVYNCSEFADTADQEYRFGNLKENTMPELMMSRASHEARRRRYNLPMDCKSCRHFEQCEGGCMRDAVLFERGMGGKFYYCRSWMMVLDRIKQSIATGEADALILRSGCDPDQVRKALGYSRAA